MKNVHRSLVSVFTSIALSGLAVAAEPDAPEDASESPDLKEVEAQISTGTKAYDAATVAELFKETQEENQRRAERIDPHLNADNLEIIELGPIEVDPYHIRNFDELLNKIDPQPRRRLQRLAELDPTAAADLQVSIRSEERFFAGEFDNTNGDGGRTANVDFRTVSDSVAGALKRAKNALRDKKVTDDQAETPAEQ